MFKYLLIIPLTHGFIRFLTSGIFSGNSKEIDRSPWFEGCDHWPGSHKRTQIAPFTDQRNPLQRPQGDSGWTVLLGRRTSHPGVRSRAEISKRRDSDNCSGGQHRLNTRRLYCAGKVRSESQKSFGGSCFGKQADCGQAVFKGKKGLIGSFVHQGVGA